MTVGEREEGKKEKGKSYSEKQSWKKKFKNRCID